jgi:hypothetical protein
LAHLTHQRRETHTAIKSKQDVQLLNLMHKLPVEKVDEYDNFPLMAQLGFIHAIPEDGFDIASATITDISFFGVFPKEIFQAMCKYGYEYEKSN